MNYNHLFKTWYQFYNKNVIGSKYFSKLIEYMNSQYVLNTVYPEKKYIFRPFSMTNYDDLKVVIIGQEPNSEGLANGLGMGIRDEMFKGCSTISNIERCLERTVKNGLFFMDHTLENWAKQGVLMLNTSLTTIEGNEGCHSIYWRPFLMKTLQELSIQETGIIYCLWGNEAQSLAQYINPRNNYILKAKNPNVEGWDCNHFNEINRILTENNGREFNIHW